MDWDPMVPTKRQISMFVRVTAQHTTIHLHRACVPQQMTISSVCPMISSSYSPYQSFPTTMIHPPSVLAFDDMSFRMLDPLRIQSPKHDTSDRCNERHSED